MNFNNKTRGELLAILSEELKKRNIEKNKSLINNQYDLLNKLYIYICF